MINNLTEAISHAKEKAKELNDTADNWKRLSDEKGLALPSDYEPCKECAKEHEQLASWLTELQERRAADRWIPVTERLPDKNGNYLVLLNNGEMTTDIFDEEELFMGFWGYMTHWRPLPPKPYESEDK